MLSYSSGDSGKRDEVEKVREATKIARERNLKILIEGPFNLKILIEGPIQYDAAVDRAVAAQNAKQSCCWPSHRFRLP